MSVPMAINPVKNDSTQKLEANLLFQGDLTNQVVIDSLSRAFNTLCKGSYTTRIPTLISWLFM